MITKTVKDWCDWKPWKSHCNGVTVAAKRTFEHFATDARRPELYKVNKSAQISPLVKLVDKHVYLIHYYGATNGGQSKILPNERSQFLGHFAKIHCPVTCQFYPDGLWGWHWHAF